MKNTPELLLTDIKITLRISHSLLDEEIKDEIAACLSDLERGGFLPIDDDDPLVRNAVRWWCRSHFTDDTKQSADYIDRYQSMRTSLTLSSDHNLRLTEVDEDD